MRMFDPLSAVTSAEQRSLLSSGSCEEQVGQEQPICGTPVDVPEPKMVICIGQKICVNMPSSNVR